MRRALIVGFNYIDDPDSDSRLDVCINDAKNIYDLLKLHEGGSNNFNSRLLFVDDKSSGESNLKIMKTADDLKKEISDVFSPSGELALFYFSGHGFRDNDNNIYLVAPDRSKLSMDELLKIVNKSGAIHKIIILDCCFAGGAGNPSFYDGKFTQINEGVSIFASCMDKQISIANPVIGVSTFTNSLIKALKGGAADLFGDISSGSVYWFLDKSFYKKQRPVFKTNVTNFVTIRKVKPPIDTDILRKITTYFKEIDSEYPLDPSYDPSPETVSLNIGKFFELQKMEQVGLIKPKTGDYLKTAVHQSIPCVLTMLGQCYWHIVKEAEN